MEAALQDWELITSFMLPLIIGVVVRKSWSSAVKSLVMFTISSFVVIMQLYIRNELGGLGDPVFASLRVIALTIAFYQGFWKQIGLTDRLEEK